MKIIKYTHARLQSITIYNNKKLDFLNNTSYTGKE